MADNYLEKKFEEYKSGKNRYPKKKITPTGNKPGTYIVKFPIKRVFVTGGANGIGKTIVSKFREIGCRVAFCDIDEKAGTTTAEATGSQFFPVDVSDANALENCMQRILENWEDIDIIINNVGISSFKDITETTLEEFDNIISTNLRPVFITSRILAIHRKNQSERNDYGRIINISSTRHLMSEPASEGYAASKGGIVSITHALAASLSPLGITVNCISPGWIECNNYETLKPADHEQHFSNRVGKPEDIARACVFLVNPDNDFINGQEITIDGGMTKKMIYCE